MFTLTSTPTLGHSDMQTTLLSALNVSKLIHVI